MDPDDLKRNFGKDMTFWGGCVNTQHAIYQLPEAVYREVRERIDIFNRDGGSQLALYRRLEYPMLTKISKIASQLPMANAPPNATMRIPLLLASFCFFYSVFLFLPMPKGAAYPFPSAEELVIGILYVPVMLTGCAILICGIANVFRKRDCWMWLLSCVMCLPLCAHFGMGVISQNNRKSSRSWPHLGMFLRDRLLEYHEAYPERFHYLGEDEEVEVNGFGDYVNTKKSEIDPMFQSYVRVRTGKVLDPWGEPVRYGLDRNHNGYISIAGQDVITDYISPPRLDYHVALVVILGHPDYGNDISPQVAKK